MEQEPAAYSFDYPLVINGCKLLTIFQRVFKELIKIHLQELANPSRFKGALVMETINSSFCENNKKFGLVTKKKRSNKEKT